MKRKLSKAGWVVVFSFLVIIMSVIAVSFGVHANNISKDRIYQLETELKKSNEDVLALEQQITDLNATIEELSKPQEEPIKEETIAETKYKVVSSSGVNVRKEANTSSSVIKILDQNDEFTGVENENDSGIWVKTEEGFVCIKTSTGYILAEKI